VTPAGPPPVEAQAPRDSRNASRRFLDNLRATPRLLRDATIRSGPPRSDRSRSEAVFGSLFLHVHSVRVHRWTLRWSATWGLGVFCAATFFLTLLTGVLLMFYYKPYPAAAYDSIKDIHYVVPTGRFIRNIHRWAGNVMVVTVLLHMARVFYTAAYRRPREYNWVVGMLLLVVTLGLAFTGYLLPWDQLALWAVTVGTNMMGYTPVFGNQVRFVLLGGAEIGTDTLLRWYVLHVLMLPFVIVIFMAIHFWRVRKDGGISGPL